MKSLMMNDIDNWAETCIALHSNSAEDYAMSQVQKMRKIGETEGADFWSKVVLAIDKFNSATREQVH